MKRMLVFGREKKQNASMEGEETKDILSVKFFEDNTIWIRNKGKYLDKSDFQ